MAPPSTSKAGRIVNCRNPSPRLVNPTVHEENEFFENLPAGKDILEVFCCHLGISLVALRWAKPLDSTPRLVTGEASVVLKGRFSPISPG